MLFRLRFRPPSHIMGCKGKTFWHCVIYYGLFRGETNTGKNGFCSFFSEHEKVLVHLQRFSQMRQWASNPSQEIGSVCHWERLQPRGLKGQDLYLCASMWHHISIATVEPRESCLALHVCVSTRLPVGLNTCNWSKAVPLGSYSYSCQVLWGMGSGGRYGDAEYLRSSAGGNHNLCMSVHLLTDFHLD